MLAVGLLLAERLSGTASDRLRGVVGIGAATTIARGLFLNVNAGTSVTQAAPNSTLTISVPYRV